MRAHLPLLVPLFLLGALGPGCGPEPPQASPISYLSLKGPEGVIAAPAHEPVTKTFPRGGYYFGNHNFRPAPDVASYIEQTAREAKTDVLRNADVVLFVPRHSSFPWFIGYAKSKDSVTAAGK